MIFLEGLLEKCDLVSTIRSRKQLLPIRMQGDTKIIQMGILGEIDSHHRVAG